MRAFSQEANAIVDVYNSGLEPSVSEGVRVRGRSQCSEPAATISRKEVSVRLHID